MDLGLELQRVEVAPEAFVRVVVGGELLTASWTGPESSVPVLREDIQALLGQFQHDLGNLPGRFETKETPVEIRVLHTVRRRAGTGPTPSGCPPKTRKTPLLKGLHRGP